MLKAIYLGGLPERCHHCDKKLLVGDYIIMMPRAERKGGFGVCVMHRYCILDVVGVKEAVLKTESEN